MPLIIPPGYADIALEFRHVLDPDPWYITYGVDISAHGGDPVTIADQSIGAWGSLMIHQHTEVKFTGVKVTIGQDGGDPVRQFVPNLGPQNGSSSAAKLPQNCAALVRKNTGVGGRRNQGRFFVPGILTEEAVSTVGVIDGTTHASINSAFNAFWVALQDEPLPSPMVILHNSTGLSPAGDPTVVTSLTLDSLIATQRRRLR